MQTSLCIAVDIGIIAFASFESFFFVRLQLSCKLFSCESNRIIRIMDIQLNRRRPTTDLCREAGRRETEASRVYNNNTEIDPHFRSTTPSPFSHSDMTKQELCQLGTTTHTARHGKVHRCRLLHWVIVASSCPRKGIVSQLSNSAHSGIASHYALLTNSQFRPYKIEYNFACCASGKRASERR